MKYIVLLLLIFDFGFARENPFIPAKDFDEDKEIATNIKENREDFDRKVIRLPSNARVLQYVILGYQVMDGSTKEKHVDIDQNIDWHDGILVSKGEKIKSLEEVLKDINTSKKEDKEPKNIQKIKINMDSKIAKMSEKIVNDSKVIKFKDLVKFEFTNKEIKITTKDKIIRRFLIPKPYKIALDFKKDNAFYTKTFDINLGSFTKVTMGSHDGYYRAAITLDGHYGYDLKEESYGYRVVLK